MPAVMGSLSQILNYMTNLLTWWVVLAPWEQAIRVRLGKHVVLLNAGIHLRIPLIDKIYIQSIRLRLLSTHTQTLTTQDGKILTVGAALGYSVKDIVKLYQTIHFPEETLRNLVASRIAQCVAQHHSDHITPEFIGSEVSKGVDFCQWGLEAGVVQITDFAFMRAYRLIMDGRMVYNGTAPDTSNPQI